MKVLVVGATGLVGSQVAETLCARGHRTLKTVHEDVCARLWSPSR